MSPERSVTCVSGHSSLENIQVTSTGGPLQVRRFCVQGNRTTSTPLIRHDYHLKKVAVTVSEGLRPVIESGMLAA